MASLGRNPGIEAIGEKPDKFQKTVRGLLPSVSLTHYPPERLQNLSMRMAMRRMTRLTNGFSKKVENLQHATSLYFIYYNFARIHSTLRVTSAMEAKITRHVWTIEEILGLLEEC